MACDISDIVDIPGCVLDTLLEFVQTAVNASLQPFLEIVRMLLMQPPNTLAFGSLWAVVIYIISTFYGLFIMFAGLNFIISSYNEEKRYYAKEWLQNTLLMIFFVQASYLVYTLISQLASGLTSGIISMIPSEFFLITIDSGFDLGLAILLGFVYFAVLLLTIITLSVNFFISSIGIVFFPFGIFFYFIPPLRDIGKFIISKVLFVLFIPFFSSIILLGVSVLIEDSAFSYFKIVFMIAGFVAVNTFMIIVALLAVFRSINSIKNSDFTKGAVSVKNYFVSGATAQKYEFSEREYYGQVRKNNYERFR